MKLELKKKVKSKILLSTIFLFSILTLVAIVVPTVLAEKPSDDTTIQDCATIQDGTIFYSEGHYLEYQPLEVGYDIFGYNYQAHTFKGSYANAYLGSPGYGFPPYEGDDNAYYQLLVDKGKASTVEEAENLILKGYPYKEVWPYRNVKLHMKWNDAWLSNNDCDADGKLDRHYGYDSYIGSGAWLTNHQWGSYIGDDGEEHNWNYFVKIVAPDYIPQDGNNDGYDDDSGADIIWGSFLVIQRVYNDPYSGDHGIEELVKPAGFGAW